MLFAAAEREPREQSGIGGRWLRITFVPFVDWLPVARRSARSRIIIGTSGWSYQSWRGPFFPREVMVKHHLRYYASQFITAELNGVFYRTPSLDAVRGWRDQTPQDFVFAWKASKFITH